MPGRQVVLITGAARGIGADAARRLAARGACVALVGLEAQELQRVAAECGDSAIAIEADVTDRSAMADAAAQVAERFGGIDAVVANAGIGGGGPVFDGDPEVWERVVEVNLLGVFRTVHACLPHVLERRGYVLVVTSVAAITPVFPFSSSYGASKAGAEGFARSLRLELLDHGVDVGVGYFSWMGTDLVSGADEHPAFRFMRSRLKGPLGRTYPVSLAGEAIVRGIERRARTVVAPRWVRALLPVRGVLVPLAERTTAPHMREAERLWREEVEERGEVVYHPAGPGGEAALRERAGRPG
jgi:NAD(P)-dependent dehydrogenase (short-subunit alcohol dehydrogenase family)